MSVERSVRDGTYRCRMSHRRYSCSAYSDLKHKVATFELYSVESRQQVQVHQVGRLCGGCECLRHTRLVLFLFWMFFVFIYFVLIWFLIFYGFSLFFNVCFCFSFCFSFILFSFLVTICVSLRAWDPVDEPRHHRLPDTVG